MTTALYRRYRPETFQEVIGQEHVTEPLRAALSGERITHAYLFSGPRGCGKTTSARILARCLNCVTYPTDTPCGECPSCVDLARGGSGSLDVVEIDAASHGGVDDARELRERATFAPARDRFKVFIIDEAHMVSPQGFNALLKLVEEPPEHVKFIFATTEPEKVIGTIRSRTHHYPFRLVPPEALETYLDTLCQEEGVAVGGGVLPMVVRAGGGSVRDSLSVLDQLVAGAIDGELDYSRAAALLGFTDATLLDDVTDAIGARDGAALFGAVDRVAQTGHDPRRFVEDLLERLRDLVVLAIAGEAGVQSLGSLPADQIERLRGQAEHIGVRRLSAVADLTNEALSEMSGATSPRLQLELLCARILLVGDAPQHAAGPDGGTGTAGAGARLPDGAPQERSTPPRLRVADSKVRPPQENVTDGRRALQVQGVPGDTSGRSSSEAVAAQQVAMADAPQALDSSNVELGPRPAAPAGEDQTGQDRDQQGHDQQGRGPRGQDRRGQNGQGQDGRDGESQQRPTDEQRPEAPVPPAPAQQPATDPGDARMIHQRWDEVVGAVGSVVPRSLLKQDARPGELAGGTLRVDFTNPALVGHFTDRGGEDELARALYETLGLRMRVQVAVGGDATPAPAAMGGWQAGDAPRAEDRREHQDGRAPRQDGRAPRQDGAGPERPAQAQSRESRPARASDTDDDPGHPAPAAPAPGAQADAPARYGPARPEPARGRARQDRRSAPGEPAPADDDGWPEVAVPGAGWVASVPSESSEPRERAENGEGGVKALSNGAPPGPRDTVVPGGSVDAAARDEGAGAEGAEERGHARAMHEDGPGVADDLVAPADDPSDPHAPPPGVPLGDHESEQPAHPGTGEAERGSAPAREDAAFRGSAAPSRRDEAPFAALAQAPVVPPPAPAPEVRMPTGTSAHPWERHLPPQARAALGRQVRSDGDASGDAFAGGWEPPPEPVDDASFDDEDAETSTEVGLPVLQEILGAVVLEEIDTTQTEQKGW